MKEKKFKGGLMGYPRISIDIYIYMEGKKNSETT